MTTPTDGDRYNALARDLTAARAEIAKLRTIVDRLPKTADGVPILSWTDVWTWWDDKPEPESVTITRFRPGIYAGCYSTREAAREAFAARRAVC